MEQSVEVFAIILFGVIGLSHILQPEAWAEFFILLRGKGAAGAFVDGLVNLPLAGIIVAFHNVRSGTPVILTIVGWCLLIKSVIRFCVPRLALRMMARVPVARSWEFQVAGVALLVLAGAFLRHGVTTVKSAAIRPTSFLVYDGISETERLPGLASWWWDHRSLLLAVTPPPRFAAGMPGAGPTGRRKSILRNRPAAKSAGSPSAVLMRSRWCIRVESRSSRRPSRS